MKSDDQKKIVSIYNATLDIISEKSVRGLTMAGISEVSGLGMSTIYNFFSSKEEIIENLYIDLQKKTSDNVYSEIVLTDPFMINLKRMFNAYFMNRWENDKIFNFLDQMKDLGEMTEIIEKSNEGVYSTAYDLLDQGKKELLVKYVDNKFLLSYMTGGIKEIVRQMKTYNLPLDQQALHTAFDLSASVVLK